MQKKQANMHTTLSPRLITKAIVQLFASSDAYSNSSSSSFMYGLPVAWKIVSPKKNQMLRQARNEQKMPQHLPSFYLSVSAIDNESN